MAFIFQSNAEKYAAPGDFRPGQIDSWRVTRYVDKLYKGALILLWEAQGKATEPVRGVWGWGISTNEPELDGDESGIDVEYKEKWVSGISPKNAPIPSEVVLALPHWSTHLLARYAVGTNFLVDDHQMTELVGVVRRLIPESQLPEAFTKERDGALNRRQFKNSTLRTQ